MNIYGLATALFCFVVSYPGMTEGPLRTQYNKSIQSITILKTDTTTIGQKLSDLFLNPSEVTGLKVTIPPGQETGWHKHTVPGFAFVSRGTLKVEIDNGQNIEFSSNQSFAEVVKRYHNGKNVGRDTVELVAFFVGQKGKDITTRRETEKK